MARGEWMVCVTTTARDQPSIIAHRRAVSQVSQSDLDLPSKGGGRRWRYAGDGGILRVPVTFNESIQRRQSRLSSPSVFMRSEC